MVANKTLTGVTIAIAMPIYNEADGIADTLRELDNAFASVDASLTLFLQNDVSTDDSINVVSQIAPRLRMLISLETNLVNSGHGPTTFAAYTRAVCADARVLMQLDSDGQFDAKELPALCQLVMNGASVVLGVRTGRVDPWFRKVLTFLLKVFLTIRYSGRFPDPNTPIRAYRPEFLAQLLPQLPNLPLIPNIYLVIQARRHGIHPVFIRVKHRGRRGNGATGTMWSGASSWGRILRLLRFSRKAIVQLLRFS